MKAPSGISLKRSFCDDFYCSVSHKAPGLYHQFPGNGSLVDAHVPLKIMFKSSVVDVILTGTSRYPYYIILLIIFNATYTLIRHYFRQDPCNPRPSILPCWHEDIRCRIATGAVFFFNLCASFPPNGIL